MFFTTQYINLLTLLAHKHHLQYVILHHLLTKYSHLLANAWKCWYAVEIRFRALFSNVFSLDSVFRSVCFRRKHWVFSIVLVWWLGESGSKIYVFKWKWTSVDRTIISLACNVLTCGVSVVVFTFRIDCCPATCNVHKFTLMQCRRRRITLP